MKKEIKLIEKSSRCCDRMVIPTRDVKECFKLLKEKWRKKMRRMEVISVEVAIFELNCEIDELTGFEEENLK